MTKAVRPEPRFVPCAGHRWGSLWQYAIVHRVWDADRLGHQVDHPGALARFNACPDRNTQAGMLIIILIVIVLLALGLYAVQLLPIDGRISLILQLVLVVIAIIYIAQVAGLA